MEEINRVMQDRLRKLEALRDTGVNPYANDFQPSTTCAEALAAGEASPPPDMNEVADDAPGLALAGRVMFKNVMGKALFLRIKDRSVGLHPESAQTVQVYVRKDRVGDETFDLVKGLDIGDIAGFEGPLFKTRTGETTLLARSARLLTKSLRPLPDKFHGLADVETRYRQRYVDLTMNPEVRHVFRQRALIVQHIREFLTQRDYVEVETPLMQPIPGGATAKPFETWHNALSMPLYLRIAPELYLKRLLVGGLERVFEIGRNFRNEGLSPKHNPEFTMIEFYQAYATFADLVDLTEEMLATLAERLNRNEGKEGAVRPFGEHLVDYARPWRRFTVREALTAVADIPADQTGDKDALVAALEARGVEGDWTLSYGHVLMHAFEQLVEHQLIQPTFITDFPIEMSPLARPRESDPAFTDRFELFIAGSEIANAFSELNDPIDQRQRFEAQVSARDKGDEEAMFMDLDYVRALEYGMPPAAGEGIGIDRLVMLMTNQQTIREVIFFPHMRPE